MKKRTLVLTGATGLLGSALVRHWAERYRVIALSHRLQIDWPGVVSVPTDLSDAAEIERIIVDTAPDLVVHAAAWTDVDGCERNPERAMAINSAASGRLAAAAARVAAEFVYISTDSVFDGSRGNYSESDLPQPVNVYSASKLAGEQEVHSGHPHPLVLRISLEGWRPAGRPGFVQWVVEALGRGERLTICRDWIRSVVFASNLPPVLEKMWSRGMAGTYHVAPASPLSNLDLAMMTAEIFGLEADTIVPISGNDLKLSARRPKDTSLDPTKLTAIMGPEVWDIRTGLVALRAERDCGALDRMREAIGERGGAVHRG